MLRTAGGEFAPGTALPYCCGSAGFKRASPRLAGVAPLAPAHDEDAVVPGVHGMGPGEIRPGARRRRGAGAVRRDGEQAHPSGLLELAQRYSGLELTGPVLELPVATEDRVSGEILTRPDVGTPREEQCADLHIALDRSVVQRCFLVGVISIDVNSLVELSFDLLDVTHLDCVEQWLWICGGASHQGSQGSNG